MLCDRLDPATPLAGARTTAALFERHALVVVEGPGHVATQQSRYAARVADAFLAGGAPPVPGTVCLPDRDPFTTS